MRRTTYLVLGAILVTVGLLGVGITVVTQASSSGISGCPGGLCGVRPGASVDDGMDAMFIQQMIPHHDDAIAMADMALTRAEHPELKRLAEDIKRTQTAENRQMRAWYQEWFDAEVPDGGNGSFGMMGGGMMGGTMTDLDALEDAESFDREFIEQMVPHHEMAIMMSQMAGSASSRPEMREFTQTIIDAQSTEIEQMLRWYEEWYGN